MRPHAASSYFPNALVNNQTLLDEGNCSNGCSRNLYFSYQTCGNIDRYSFRESEWRKEAAKIASRGKLRISIPGDEPPYITTAGPNETNYVQGTSRRGGSVVRYMTSLLSQPPPLGLGLEWEEVPIPQASYDAYPSSSFTACCHSVAINSTDLCIGSIWLFEFRQRLAPFTGAIFQASMKVIAKKVPAGADLSFSEMMYQPFSPFDGGMWLALFCALLYGGYALYTLDATGHADEEDDDDEDAFGENSLTGQQKMQAKYEMTRFQMFCPTTYDDVVDMAKSMLYAVQAFLSGGDLRFEPNSPQAWVVFVGFSFLILVTISNYTAMVTANNVVSMSQGAINSLDEGLDRGYTFCGWDSFKQPMEAAFPKMRGRYTGLGNGNDAFLEMDKGNCDAAILDDMSWTMAKNGLFSKPEDDPRYASHGNGPEAYHCDTKALLPENVFSVDIALPVRSDLQRLLSWAILDSRSKGKWTAEMKNTRSSYPNMCTESNTGPSSLGFTSGAGIIILSIFTSTAGLILNLLWRASPHQCKRRREWAKMMKARHAEEVAKPTVHPTSVTIEHKKGASEPTTTSD